MPNVTSIVRIVKNSSELPNDIDMASILQFIRKSPNFPIESSPYYLTDVELIRLEWFIGIVLGIIIRVYRQRRKRRRLKKASLEKNASLEIRGGDDDNHLRASEMEASGEAIPQKRKITRRKKQNSPVKPMIIRELRLKRMNKEIAQRNRNNKIRELRLEGMRFDKMIREIENSPKVEVLGEVEVFDEAVPRKRKITSRKKQKPRVIQRG